MSHAIGLVLRNLPVWQAMVVADSARERKGVIEFELLEEESVLVVTPKDALEREDFERLTQAVDPYLEEHGALQGLMIVTESFPGWRDFEGLLSHLRFVRNHHQRVEKVAAVTDSGFLAVMPSVASHFVDAEVRHFDFDDRAQAMAWLTA